MVAQFATPAVTDRFRRDVSLLPWWPVGCRRSRTRWPAAPVRAQALAVRCADGFLERLRSSRNARVPPAPRVGSTGAPAFSDRLRGVSAPRLRTVPSSSICPNRKEASCMSLFRAIKSVLGGAGHWIAETYCTVGQKLGERVEQISDAVAEKKYLAQPRPEYPEPGHSSLVPLIEHKDYRKINGHKHTG